MTSLISYVGLIFIHILTLYRYNVLKADVYYFQMSRAAPTLDAVFWSRYENNPPEKILFFLFKLPIDKESFSFYHW